MPFNFPLYDIATPTLLTTLRRKEQRGSIEAAHHAIVKQAYYFRDELASHLHDMRRRFQHREAGLCVIFF